MTLEQQELVNTLQQSLNMMLQEDFKQSSIVMKLEGFIRVYSLPVHIEIIGDIPTLVEN